jgi:hypothetical protein
MVNSCANPKCGKPLHYLRDGRVFLFDVVRKADGASVHRREHFWLCGECSKMYFLEQNSSREVLITPRRTVRPASELPLGIPLAS